MPTTAPAGSSERELYFEASEDLISTASRASSRLELFSYILTGNEQGIVTNNSPGKDASDLNMNKALVIS